MTKHAVTAFILAVLLVGSNAAPSKPCQPFALKLCVSQRHAVFKAMLRNKSALRICQEQM